MNHAADEHEHFAPKVDHQCEERSQMQQHIQGHARRVETQQPGHQDQVAGAADRQKLGQTLQNPPQSAL